MTQDGLTWACPDCHKQFSTRDEYLEHRKTPCTDSKSFAAYPVIPTYPQIVATGAPFICKLCERKFGQAHGLHCHYTKAHKPSNKPTPPQQIALPSKAVFAPDGQLQAPKPVLVVIKYCQKCGILWDSPYDLKACLDCGGPLETPKKRKSVQVQEVKA